MKALVFGVGLSSAACFAPAPPPEPAAPARQGLSTAPAAQRMAVVQAPGSRPVDPTTGWQLVGSGPNHFEFVGDREVWHGGQASARLRALTDPEDEFGALMQDVAPREFRAKRVQLSGFVRTENVSGWAGLWMRVDRTNGRVESFDNMQDRPIKGSTEWTRYDIVLDVQADATNIAFGVLQYGTGTTWVDDLRMQIVASSVETTGPAQNQKPTNLDFEG